MWYRVCYTTLSRARGNGASKRVSCTRNTIVLCGLSSKCLGRDLSLYWPPSILELNIEMAGYQTAVPDWFTIGP
jgi:hypothetical protein